MHANETNNKLRSGLVHLREFPGNGWQLDRLPQKYPTCVDNSERERWSDFYWIKALPVTSKVTSHDCFGCCTRATSRAPSPFFSVPFCVRRILLKKIERRGQEIYSLAFSLKKFVSELSCYKKPLGTSSCPKNHLKERYKWFKNGRLSVDTDQPSLRPTFENVNGRIFWISLLVVPNFE